MLYNLRLYNELKGREGTDIILANLEKEIEYLTNKLKEM